MNAALEEVLDRVLAAARPPEPPASTVGFHYRNEHMSARMQRRPSDAAWRAKIGPDGIAWTDDGIPFRSAKTGHNIGVVTRAGGFPDRLGCAGGRGREEFVPHAERDHVPVPEPRRQPADLARLGGRRRRVGRPREPIGNRRLLGHVARTFPRHARERVRKPRRAVRAGGSRAAGDLSRPVAVDTEAHLVRVPLRHGVRLERLAIEAVANDAVFGIMGASILRQEADHAVVSAADADRGAPVQLRGREEPRGGGEMEITRVQRRAALPPHGGQLLRPVRPAAPRRDPRPLP